MTGSRSSKHLSRREQQVMDIVYRLGKASVADVLQQLDDPPSYSSIRAKLGVLERKGHLIHKSEGAKYVYYPKVPRNRARRSALKKMLQTFFEGSTGAAAVALLEMEPSQLTREEIDALSALIEKAKKEGR